MEAQSGCWLKWNELNICLQSPYEWSCPREIVACFSAVLHTWLLPQALVGLLAGTVVSGTLVYIDSSSRAGVGTQQQVLLCIQYHFALFRWLLLELCAFHTSENEDQKDLHQTIIRWGSQDQWMHVFMLLWPRWSWLPHFSFDLVCHFPLICLFPCPPCFLGTPASRYQKSGPADRWPVNSTVRGSCHWWPLQTKSPASRYLFWLPKTCFCLIRYVLVRREYAPPCLAYSWAGCPVCPYDLCPFLHK